MKLNYPPLAVILFLGLVYALSGIAKEHTLGKEKTDVPLTRLDINRASAEEFAKLPGIGPELAHRIVAYRTKHGPFQRVEDLLVIRGIGPKKWKALRPYLRVEPHS